MNKTCYKYISRDQSVPLSGWNDQKQSHPPLFSAQIRAHVSFCRPVNEMSPIAETQSSVLTNGNCVKRHYYMEIAMRYIQTVCNYICAASDGIIILIRSIFMWWHFFWSFEKVALSFFWKMMYIIVRFLVKISGD